MNVVGKLGSYISRDVYTVSGPFHPFGGAIDIIVVQQPDVTFKSSHWHIRIGKCQGVLKTKEKIVSISVNGVESGSHMYLDHKGKAYFLKEPDTKKGEVAILPQTSGGVREERLGDAQFMKVQSCNYDGSMMDSIAPNGAKNEKILTRSTSQKSRILGLMFG